MSRRGLEVLAVFLNVSSSSSFCSRASTICRASCAQDIAAEEQQLPQSQKQFQSARNEVTADIAVGSRICSARIEWSRLFRSASASPPANWTAPSGTPPRSRKLLKANRRQDRDQAERLLKEERRCATAALNEAAVDPDGSAALGGLKRNLPTELQQMEADHQTLQHTDFAPITAVVDARRSGLAGRRRTISTCGWLRCARFPPMASRPGQSSDAMRRKAEANDLAGLDYAALLTAAETLHNDATALPARTAEIQALTGQLYTSWDKVLVDLRDRKSGGIARLRRRRSARSRRSCRMPPVKKGDTNSDESWVEVSKATYQANEKNIGMAVGHKPAGKYDTEADDVPEPAGFAYMAPVGSERNQYGYWDHRDGGNFWMWYGQYALLRDLLWGHSYQPDSVLRVGVLPHGAQQRADLLRPRRSRQRAEVWHARHLHPAALCREPLRAQFGRLQ